MKRGASILVALAVGAAIGACVRDVVRPAEAQGQSNGHRYKVVGGSMSESGYEEDLNREAMDGWHYVGTIPRGQGNASLVFER